MPSFPQQFLYTVDGFGCPVELINGARTMANLAAANDARFGDIRLNCDCPALLLDPSEVTYTPPLGVSQVTWGALDTHIQQAPWFLAGYGPSSEAYGFMIDQWTGLDGAQHGRTTLASLSGRGGSYYGPLGDSGRVWKLNVRLFGASERGLNYLFRWLENQLMGCCSADGGASIWIREFCPTSVVGDAVEDGMARADRVVLLEGPTWEDTPIPDFGCIWRTVSFTLGVGDPCLYRPYPNGGASFTGMTKAAALATAIAKGAAGDGPYDSPLHYVEAACGVWTGSSSANCTALPRATTGKMSAIVTISSPAESAGGVLFHMPDMRIVGHYDRSGNAGTCDPCSSTRQSVIILRGILAGEVVEVDLGRRTVRRKGALNGAEWEDASYLVVQTFPMMPWAAFGPEYIGQITLEPASCDQFLSGHTDEYGDMVSTWTTFIQAQEHHGCRC